MFENIKSSFDKKDLPTMQLGSMCYMMSRDQYLRDANGRSPGSEEGGAAGAGTALGQAGQAAEAAVVPPALRWRAGIEATMSTLKHPFSMARAIYKGDREFQRYVGWCVITKNLFSIARYQQRRRDHDQVS
jgi:hypothetical protein